MPDRELLTILMQDDNEFVLRSHAALPHAVLEAAGNAAIEVMLLYVADVMVGKHEGSNAEEAADA